MVSVELKRRLRWADADAAGRLHFPRIFEIVEEAETELLREIGWLVEAKRSHLDFPRVHLDCHFQRILALDEQFRLRLAVGKLGRTSIRYDFHVFNGADELAIKGTMTVVLMKDGKPIEIPQSLRSAALGEK